MFSRLKRTASTLIMVIAVYFVYATFAVPLVEPKLQRPRAGSARAALPRMMGRKLDHLFPPGSWELGRPKVIETDQGTLLFDDYKPQPGGRLDLTRCTVVCYVDNHSDRGSQGESGTSERRPVILRALHGATLTFDQALDVLRGKIGRLIGGRLTGEITITSPASGPGRDDALEILTRNVQLDSQRIWTPHEVRFRYGPNTGHGRDLTIHLTPPAKSKPGESGLGVGGLQLLELVHLDRLQLFLNSNGLFGDTASAPPTATREPVSDEPGAPIDVGCRGPLRFDFQQQIITLEKQVDLLRHNPSGPSDQLLCELLEIHFTGGPGVDSAVPAEVSPVASPQRADRRRKLTPSKVIALGYPVIIRAHSIGVGTRAERVEYDCILRRVWLKDREKATFHDRQRTVEAREVRYVILENGRLGDLDAVGPGRVQSAENDGAQEWQVAWDGEVLMRRVEGAPLLSFSSQVNVQLAQTGSFSADTLHLYLREVPRTEASDKVRVELDRLHAVGNVAVETARLIGHVGEARLWFRPAPAGSPATSPLRADVTTPAAPGLPGLGQIPGRPASDPAERSPQKFELSADLIEALVYLGDQPLADRLALRGHVALREITAGEPQPIVIRGDLFELQDGASEHPRGALLGQPAVVLARGMATHAERFHIYPGDNNLHIVGPGDMSLPARLAAETGRATEQPARIHWKTGMEFDGQTAKFDGDVSVNLTQPSRDGETRCVALGEVLRAHLTRRVDFRKPQVDGPARLAEFNFDGWGFLEVEMFDAGGQRKAADQMQVRELSVNQITGEIRGQGPGWVRGIHRGGDLLNPSGEEAAAPIDRISPSNLTFLRIDFHRNLAGNLHRRQLEFLEGTKTLYGPVKSWDEALDQLPGNALPPDAAVLTCDRLAVAQPGGEKNAHQLELEATGNAYVEGRSFSASGGRISYTRAKDQLILEGDGRNNATLAFQKQLGSPPSRVAARKILFWPGTRQVQMFDFHQTEIYDLGQLRSIRSPGTRTVR